MRVLITGGTGALGAALAASLLADDEAEMVGIYSRGEARQAEMRARHPDARMRWIIGDVRDVARLAEVVPGYTHVVHAAALKRVEVGESCPAEVVATNVIGACNVARVARSSEARAVLVSTDKAVCPSTAYGAAKLLAERIFMASGHGVVRYGNVAGSTGSVIPLWRAAARDGRVCRLTDPECTRYWISMNEAVRMVRWALGRTGPKIVVPSLPAYRLGDLAEAMGAWTEIIGLGRAEKRHECMIGEEEAEGYRRCGEYWVRGIGPGEMRREAMTSDQARRMSVDELRDRLAWLDD